MAMKTNIFAPINQDVYEKISEIVTEWYGMPIPQFGSRSFISFVSSSSGLVTPLAKRRYDLRINYEGYTASVDIAQAIISLPGWAFTEDGWRNVLDAVKLPFPHLGLDAIAIAVVNAWVIHEGLHLKYTKLQYKDVLKSLKSSPTMLTSETGLMAQVFQMFNAIEDIYIEAKLDGTVLYSFLQIKNAILNHTEEVKFKGGVTNVKECLEFCALMKNTAMHEVLKACDNELFELVSQAYDLDSQIKRSELALTIFERYPRTETRLANTSSSGFYGGEMLTAVDDDDSKRVLAKQILRMDTAAKIAEAAKTLEINAKVEESRFAEVDPLVEKSIKEFAGSFREHKKIEASESLGFAQLLKELKSKNHAPGEVTKKGTALINTRLYRIATDNKMFAYRNFTKTTKGVEVILLVDLSGSTSSADLYMHELSAAKSIFKDCSRAGVPIEVWAHSSKGMYTPLVVKIASYGFSNAINFPNPFDIATAIDRLQNFDGYVIEHVAKKFTSKPSTKVLMVLSDGRPSGGGYGGYDANLHTREKINGARGKGIAVFSLSLVNKVVEDNNAIYGKEWNIDCSKTHDIKPQMRTLITQIVKENYV